MKKLLFLLVVLIVFITSSYSVIAQVCPFSTTEGGLLQIRAEGYDPDPEIGPAGRLIWTYPFPFNENGEWQTQIGDAGVYRLVFGLSDGEYTDNYKACLEVFSLLGLDAEPKKLPEHNNPPLLFGLKDQKMFVGETLRLHINCMDIDGDDVDITYYGWPGELVHTATLSEVGTHTAEVVCTDTRGAETKQKMFVQVIPRSAKPVITLDRIVFYEGEEIDLRRYVYDLDTPKEDLMFEATGVFEKSLVWYTSKGDVGVYPTTLFVSDGQNLVSRDIVVEILERSAEVIDVNYPKKAKPTEWEIVLPEKEETICAPCPSEEVEEEPEYEIEVVYPKQEKETFWSLSKLVEFCKNYIV